MRIPGRYVPVLFGALVSIIMVSMVSASVILLKQGTHDFFIRWAKSVITIWPIAFPAVLVVTPIVQKLLARLTAEQAV